MNEHNEEQAKLWIAPDLSNMELLRATYVKHAFPRHFHDTYVIIVQERGVDEFLCRGEVRHAPAGSIAIVNPYEVHTGRAGTDEPWGYRAIYPSPTLLQEIASESTRRNDSAPYFPAPVVFDPALVRSLYRLHLLLETSPDSLERQTTFVVTLAQLISRHSSAFPIVKDAGAEPQAVRRARQYIEAYYSENLSLAQLANVAQLNPSYLVRAFRKELGLPPHEYLTQVRIHAAKKLLAAGHTIADVALEAGFTDQSHFTNRFKRLVGFTPKQYARQVGTRHPLPSSGCLCRCL